MKSIVLKGNLKFIFSEPADNNQPLKLINNKHEFPGNSKLNFLFSANYEDKEICRLMYRENGTKINPIIYIDIKFQEEPFILASIVKILVLESEQRGIYDEISFFMDEHQNLKTELEKQSFINKDNEYSRLLDYKKGKLITETKKAVLEKIKNAQKIGRGYVVSTADISFEGLQLLSQEYNEIAWGLTSWAKNSDIDDDEKEIIQKYASQKKTLEVGAGSGRLSEFIQKFSSETTLTDYTHESCHILREKFNNLEVYQDDIANTKLKDGSYDTVFFLENGLGNLLDARSRKTAIKNMCQLLSPKGQLVLGFRTLDNVPCEHVMIASQNEHIIGIYHTFSFDEVSLMIPHGFCILTKIDGNPRPAGGYAFFVIIERKKS